MRVRRTGLGPAAIRVVLPWPAGGDEKNQWNVARSQQASLVEGAPLVTRIG